MRPLPRTEPQGTRPQDHAGAPPKVARVRLRQVLVANALLAIILALLVPILKKVLFPETWNTWIVKTAKRPDGAIVRLRIRRYPDRDVVFEEILRQPQPELPGPNVPEVPAHTSDSTDPH
jgi:hypothetical protein